MSNISLQKNESSKKENLIKLKKMLIEEAENYKNDYTDLEKNKRNYNLFLKYAMLQFTTYYDDYYPIYHLGEIVSIIVEDYDEDY